VTAIAVEAYRDDLHDGVRALWRMCFDPGDPWNRDDAAIPAKLAVQPELFLVATEGGQVVGSVMAGYDGHRGWLHGVAVSPTHQRRGVGALLVAEAEKRLAAIGCPKVNLQVRSDNEQVAAFYRALGYAVEPRLSMGKLLSA
jgi:ribosomal protein S18 acetylase RimI-like enzyme